jgi:hypothetical protein
MSPNQLSPTQADTSTTGSGKSASSVSTITNRASAPAVGRAPAEPRRANAGNRPPAEAEHAPPGQVKNKPNAKHRD